MTRKKRDRRRKLVRRRRRRRRKRKNNLDVKASSSARPKRKLSNAMKCV